MASFCVAVIRGINIPLLLVLEVTSKAAEAAGVLVPMPTWAKVFRDVINAIISNKSFELTFILLGFILRRGEANIRLKF